MSIVRATRRRFLAALTAGLGTPRVLSAAFQQPAPAPHEVPWLGEAQRPPVPLPTDAPTVRPICRRSGRNPVVRAEIIHQVADWLAARRLH